MGNNNNLYKGILIMTKKQKLQRIQDLRSVILKHGFSVDSYGNFKLDTGKSLYRFKFKANNLRFETKWNRTGAQWFGIFSTPIVKIEPENLKNYLQKRIK
jgi:hypothetical protein